MKNKRLYLNWIIFFILTIVSKGYAGAPKVNFKILNLNQELSNIVTTQLQLKQQTIKTEDQETIKSFYYEAPPKIAKILECYGYFNSATKITKFTRYKNRWDATFAVQLGPPLKITAIKLVILGAGKEDKNIQRELSKFPLQTGEIFRTDKYSTAKQFLFDLIDTYGYATGFFEAKKVVVDLEKHSAEIWLNFNTGPQYFFSHTTFNAPVFSPKFLAKFLPYKPGEPYSNKKLNALHENLSNSNFFQDITITPQLDENKTHGAAVEVTLLPRKSKQYNLGVGFGTNTGIQGMLEVEIRHLTARGHRFKGSIQGSQVQNNFELHYLIPGAHPTTDLYDLDFTGQTLHFDKGKSLSFQEGAAHTTTIKEWYQTIKLRFQHEHYKLIDQPYKNSTLFIPSVNWSYSKYDDPIKPTHGYSFKINLQGASKHFLASDNFFQVQVDAKYLKTVMNKLQLLLHGVLGFTEINEINNLPLSLQFYAGGTQSIRGFGYNTIGPGYNLIIGSVEFRYPIVNDWYLTTFCDTGNANNNLLAKLKQSVGGGIVYRSSIGTLELTYAKAVSERGTPGRVQFNLGLDL